MSRKSTRKRKPRDVFDPSKDIEDGDDVDEKDQNSIADLNPWAVKNLSEFLFYNCPECSFKSKTTGPFLRHAYGSHLGQTEVLPSSTVSEGVTTRPDDGEDDQIAKVEAKTKVPHQGEWQCYLCGLQKSSEREIRDHVKADHPKRSKGVWTCGPPRQYQCNQCCHTFVSENSLKLHICGLDSTLTPGQKSCHLCPRSFKSKDGLVKHMAKEHDLEKKFECDQCDYKAAVPSLLKKHVNRKHSEQSLDHLCQECGKSFKDKDYLQNHIRTRHQKEELTCFSCGVYFPSQKALGVHLKEVHDRTGNRTLLDVDTDNQAVTSGYNCESCGLGFTEFSRLRKHLRTEHKYTPPVTETKRKQSSANVGPRKKHKLPCRYCGKILTSPTALKHHINRHHENTDLFNCPKCNKIFYRECELNRHVDFVHENRRGSDCDLCGKRFISKYLMERHVRFVHEKKESYTCGNCDFQTHSPYILKAHIEQVHEKRRPHKCEFCDAAFYYLRDKEKHVGKFHADTNVITASIGNIDNVVNDVSVRTTILEPQRPLAQFHITPEMAEQITIIQHI